MALAPVSLIRSSSPILWAEARTATDDDDDDDASPSSDGTVDDAAKLRPDVLQYVRT